MAAPFSWSFTTAAAPGAPTLTSESPDRPPPMSLCRQR